MSAHLLPPTKNLSKTQGPIAKNVKKEEDFDRNLIPKK